MIIFHHLAPSHQFLFFFLTPFLLLFTISFIFFFFWKFFGAFVLPLLNCPAITPSPLSLSRSRCKFSLALHNHFSKLKLPNTSQWKWCLNRLQALNIHAWHDIAHSVMYVSALCDTRTKKKEKWTRKYSAANLNFHSSELIFSFYYCFARVDWMRSPSSCWVFRHP